MPQEKGGWADSCVKECRTAQPQNRPIRVDPAGAPPRSYWTPKTAEYGPTVGLNELRSCPYLTKAWEQNNLAVVRVS